jgi:hypothetical protein
MKKNVLCLFTRGMWALSSLFMFLCTLFEVLVKSKKYALYKVCKNALIFYYLHFNWAKEIKHLLDIHGFSYVWHNYQTLNHNKFIKEFIERVKSQYLQNWYSVVESSSKLSVYNIIK